MEGFPRESPKHSNMNFAILQVLSKERMKMELLAILCWQWGKDDGWGSGGI